MVPLPPISELQKKLGMTLPIGAAFGVVCWILWNFPSASNQGYAPEQPIPFSHKLHAGDNKIPCLYCHSSAEKSRHAGIPPLKVCMNCHIIVKRNSPYIRRLKKAFALRKPIEWVRVHELPDFVYFPHKRHLAKGIDCEVCHGEVRKMERMEQKAPLTMGWCMECHRGQTAPTSVKARVYPGVKNPQGPVAPVNCSTCHN